MRKHDKWWVIGACAIIVLLAIYNCFTNPNFWILSVANCMTLLVAVVVSFFLVPAPRVCYSKNIQGRSGSCL